MFLLLASCGPPLPVLRDLTEDLGQAEVCTVPEESCIDGPRAAELHGFDLPGVTRVLTLPPATASNLYLRLPDEGGLALEYRGMDAGLAIDAVRPGGEAVRLHASGATGSAWRTVEVSTAGLAGQVVRLAFTVTPVAGRPPGVVLVRKPALRG
ncbi:MAG TPA: hypothetical protein VKA21_12840, partial [Candidatus Binatia bacterium]|nr:hypothetical protein [Candidatus Binatia bacterium]